MKNRSIIINIIKSILGVLTVGIYIYLITIIYNTNIWVFKVFVLLLLLIIFIYFIFKFVNIIIPIKKQIVAQIVDVKKDKDNIDIIYQYLDIKYKLKVEFYEYDQNKFFKYSIHNWYTIIVKNNKVIEVLDPATEPVIDNNILEKHKLNKKVFIFSLYMYYIFEFLLLINLILFPLEVVVTKYNMNNIIFILIELINVILFFINSYILKKNK